MRTLMRALRRARVPLRYSQGFNPKPKIAFGPALGMGLYSEAEYADLEVQCAIDSAAVLERLNTALPKGLRVHALREIRRDLPALADAVRAARYRVQTGAGRALAEELAEFGARDDVTIVRERKGRTRTFELSQELLDLNQLDAGTIRLTLAMGQGASVRPDEALHAIFGERAAAMQIVREELLVDFNGRLVNPMLAASAAASHALRAVS